MKIIASEESLVEMPEPPSNFNTNMSNFWFKVGNSLIDKKILSTVDLPNFQRYVEIWYGYELVKDLLFEPTTSPQEIYKVITLSKQLDSIGSKLGLDPLSRSKMNIQPKAKISPLKQKLEESRFKKIG